MHRLSSCVPLGLVPALVTALAVAACSGGPSDTTSPGAAGASPSNAACPALSGTFKVATHCDASLVGKDVVVTQTGCALKFAAPFDGFTATVAADGKLTVSGPQSCTGTASTSSISMSCTPGTCAVTLSR